MAPSLFSWNLKLWVQFTAPASRNKPISASFRIYAAFYSRMCMGIGEEGARRSHVLTNSTGPGGVEKGRQYDDGSSTTHLSRCSACA